MARDRIQATKQMIANSKKTTVSNLSGIFQITEETIHRGLEKLEDGSLLTRTHGGVVLNTATLTENTYSYRRASPFYGEKQFTTHKVLPSVDNKATMAADSGSTAMELLKLLQDRSDPMLPTNPMGTIHVLVQSEIKAVSMGGELNKNTLSLQGGITKEIISRYHVDIMVMSCKDLGINSGMLDSNEAEAEIKKATIRQATEVALLVDHSKLDRKALAQLTDSSYINYIITDKSSGAEQIAFRKNNNVRLV